MFRFARLLRLALGDSFQAALNELNGRARIQAEKQFAVWRFDVLCRAANDHLVKQAGRLA